MRRSRENTTSIRDKAQDRKGIVEEYLAQFDARAIAMAGLQETFLEHCLKDIIPKLSRLTGSPEEEVAEIFYK